jgi:hypothetical protein
MSLLSSNSMEFTNKEKQQAAKVLFLQSSNFTFFFYPLVNLCIEWLKHDAKNDLDSLTI